MTGETILPATGKSTVFDLSVLFDDTGNGAATVRHGVAEIYSWDAAKSRHKVRRPAADNLPWSLCVALPGALVAPSAADPIAVAAFWLSPRQIVAGLHPDSDAPAVGADLGTVAGAWGLKVGNSGFVCTGVISDVTGRRLVYVRPTGGGGGGSTLSFVQAVADGASGEVSVKTIGFLADITATPNYAQSGDAFDLKYFKG